MSILIKNGRIITASEDYIADIYTEGEKISLIGSNLNVKADEVIDASGKLVMPGGIDPHVHLEMPFMGTFSSDNYETGTLAALHGAAGTRPRPRAAVSTLRRCSCLSFLCSWSVKAKIIPPLNRWVAEVLHMECAGWFVATP